jgi:cytochrome c oxidase subunit III
VPELLSEIEEQAVALLDHSGPPTGGEDDGGIGPWRRPGGTPRRTYTTGMLVAMVGSSTFFLALVSASVIHREMPGSDWMPLRPPSILWVTSAIAIVSSLTLVRARGMFKSAEYRGFSRWWTTTAVLGICFLGGQLWAFHRLEAAGVYLVSNPSVSFFYVFTVAIALLWIAWRPSTGRSRSTSTSVAALYWHF